MTTINDLAVLVDGEVVGDGTLTVSEATSPASGRPDSITFAETPAALEAALAGGAGAVVVRSDAEGETDKVLIRTGHPRIAFVRIAAALHPERRPADGVHPDATVDDTADLGDGVSVGAGAVVGARVSIGAGTILFPRAVVGEDVTIGPDCRLHPGVVCYPGITLGARVIIHAGTVLGSDGFGYVDTKEGKLKFPQLGTLIIADDVEIGANATIDRAALDATTIGRGTKLDNLVHVAHNVEIGENVALSAHVGIAGTTKIGSHVIMGGQAGVGDHSIVEDGAILGGGCGVLPRKTLRGGGQIYWGMPAVPLDKAKRQFGELALLGKLRQRVKALEKRVGELS